MDIVEAFLFPLGVLGMLALSFVGLGVGVWLRHPGVTWLGIGCAFPYFVMMIGASSPWYLRLAALTLPFFCVAGIKLLRHGERSKAALCFAPYAVLVAVGFSLIAPRLVL